MAARVRNRRAAHRAVEAPVIGRGGIGELVGEPCRPEEPDIADPAICDHSAHQCDGRQASVIEADGIAHASLLRGVSHRERLSVRARQRLLAQDGLACPSRGVGNLGMRPGRSADVNNVNVGALDEFAPVGGPLLYSVFGSSSRDGTLDSVPR